MPNLNRRPAWLTLRKTTLVLSVCIATAACWALSSSIFNPASASVAYADDEKPRQEKTRQREGDRPSPEREVRREGDRPGPEREVRRDGNRSKREREVSVAQLYSLVQQLRKEVATLRLEVRRLHARSGDRPARELDQPRPERDERGARERPQETPRNPFGPSDP
ncbi:MAG: hypothetical protein VB862_18190 [Pirellulaceae bacterium]